MARISKEEWGQLKELPIVGYLDYKGIDYIKETKNYYRLADHHSLVINLKKNTYSWNSRQSRNGDLGNFIEEYEGVTKPESLARWLEFAKYSEGLEFDIKKRYATVPDNYKFDWEKIKKSDNYDAAKSYLVNERNLGEGFVDRLFKSGTIYSGYKFKDRNSGAILNAPVYFPWKDENGKVVGADRQGTTINFEKFSKRGTEKKISRGSDTEYGFNLSFGTGADKLIVFEAPIDALSYIQQNMKDLVNDNSTIFATSGGDYSKIGLQLQRMTDNNGKVPDSLVLATDNDLAGFNLANHFNVEFASREIPVMGKDWNDQLKAGVTGIKKMTMDESVQHAKSLNDLKNAEAVEVPDDVFKDDNQAIKSVSQPKTYQNKKERTLATRKANEQTIKNAMNNVKTIQKDPNQVKKYLDFIANNSEFSTRNSLIMFSQYPDAEMMKGSREFKDMGFFIQKGETGSRILGAPQKAPFLILEDGSRIKQSDASTDQLRLSSEGKLKVSEFKYYPIVTVFDVKQTTADSKHISQLLNNRQTSPKLSDLTENQANAAYDILANQANQMGIKLNVENNASMFNQRDSKVNGVFATKKNDPLDQTIFIREGLSPYEKVSALATELGQASLHNTIRGNEVEVIKNPEIQKKDSGKKVWYHGSSAEFDQFKNNNQNIATGRTFGFGTYLTDDLERARGYAGENGFIYEVEPQLNKALSSNEITLSHEEVSKILTGLSKQQIEDDGYPYLISDYGVGEPTEEWSEYNEQMVSEIADKVFESSENDTDVINELNNTGGDPDLVAKELNKMGRTHIINTIDFEEGPSQELIVQDTQNLRITNKYAVNSENKINKIDSNEGLKAMQSKMASYVVLKHIGIEPDVPIENDLSNWSEVMKKVNDSQGKVLAQVTQTSKVVTRNLDEKLSNYLDEKPVIKQLSNTKKSVERQNNQVLMDESNYSRSNAARR